MLSSIDGASSADHSLASTLTELGPFFSVRHENSK